VKLGELTRGIAQVDSPELMITGLCDDSRRIEPGQLFIARRGVEIDAARYVEEAIARGAVAVLAERSLSDDIACATCSDPSAALGALAARWYGEPGRSVDVVGITGTNGKTTTAFLLKAILSAAGHAPSLVGTVYNEIGGQRRTSTHTTPDALTLHALLSETRAAGGRSLVLEVSSHALEQRRVAGIAPKVGVFTNLSQDHLDYHGSLERYRAVKRRLFEGLEGGATAVLNAGDPCSVDFAAAGPARLLRYGFSPDLELVAEVGRERITGSELQLRYQGRVERLELPMVGRYNVENALAATGAALALGVPLELCAKALDRGATEGLGVPGRLERVSEPQPPAVFVDYAHTEDALARVLETLRPLTSGHLRVVFGCGGDRDKGKRPKMAAAVAARADEAIVTSDNPRSEDPEAIARDVLRGFGGAPCRVVLDRAEAIAAAIDDARVGDVVLIAGKGHEQEQVVGAERRAFCDRATARAALARWRSR
jgi:UDP-N-acetylmuramoyl-L-alanyl-D-glutamate--2,6-diaminopimelate ligase